MEQREQSEFNMAVAWLNRLNLLFYAADQAAIELDMYTWLHSLMALFRELSTEMKDQELATFKTAFSTLSTRINTLLQKQKRQGILSLPQDIHADLHDLEIKLRKIMKQAGLLTRVQDSASRALR